MCGAAYDKLAKYSLKDMAADAGLDMACVERELAEYFGEKEKADNQRIEERRK